MPATHDHLATYLGRNWPQTTRSIYSKRRVDFSAINHGAGETGLVEVLRAGTLLQACVPVIVTPEGGAATASIGIEGNLTLLVPSVNLNGAAGSMATVTPLSLDVSATYVEAEVQSIANKVDSVIAIVGNAMLKGWYFAADTEIWVQELTGTPDTAVVDLLFTGIQFPV